MLLGTTLSKIFFVMCREGLCRCECHRLIVQLRGSNEAVGSAFSGKPEIIVSPQVLEEFRRVSVEKIGVDPQKIDAFLQEFIKTVEIIMPPYQERLEVRDPDDIDILAAAIKAKVDVLVSGNKDLLEFKESPIPVMKPRALYDMLVGDA